MNHTIVLLLLIASILILCVLLIYDFRRDMMMLQQNSYRNERYGRWLKMSGDIITLPRGVMMVGIFASLFLRSYILAPVYLSIIASVIGLFTLKGKKYKKPLVVTSRVMRNLCVMWGFAIGLAFAAIFIGGFNGKIFATTPQYALSCAIIGLMGVYSFSPYITIIANTLLDPVQKMINRRYYNDAANILKNMPSLKVIGITGSYGKTSTKHYLYRILSERFETIMTPGSFNTTLGVVRTIRENLQPYTEIFIAEMGAKQSGDIKEICDLVHPEIGIVTAVGPQHLESFKTIENVQRTKFELIDSLPEGGLAVVNNDFEYIENRKIENVATIRYGIKNRQNASAKVIEIVTSAEGSDFKIEYNTEILEFHTRLVGECNVSNLTAAIVVALHLGMDSTAIRRAVAQIEQVEHRLNIKRTSGGIVIIDDAFNSNPTGSAMALDVLKSMNTGKRIIITPGMIELGECQTELNTEFGRKIAESVDIAIIVGDYNRDAISDGITSVEKSDIQLITVPDFATAQLELQKIAKAGDIVLYENDLPDTFN